MIVDVTGTILIPGNRGKDCPGNGERVDSAGNLILCCDECDYMLCCFWEYDAERCKQCADPECPNAGGK